MKIPTNVDRPDLHVEIRSRKGVRRARHGIVVCQTRPEGYNSRLVLKPDEALALADALVDTVELDVARTVE